MNDKNLMRNNVNDKLNIILPALIFFVINTMVQYYNERSYNMFDFDFIGFCISMFSFNLISQVFAYLTCLFCVIKRNKGQNGVWINYIVWILILNIGVVANLLEN